jgi:plasmid stabilization system protein ParE
VSYRLAPSAVSDINAIADAIDLYDSAAALRFLTGLRPIFSLLGERPLIGHQRLDLTSRPVRFWTAFRRYAVIYEVGPPVAIIHVRDWRRNPETLID